jgi:DNA-binding transcriptional ArsR family regulator
MTKKGILKTRREGQSIYFSLSSKKVAQACRLMREVLIDTLQKQNKVLEKLI